MKRIIIFGATSAIAKALARSYAKEGAALYLLARETNKLDSLQADLLVRGAASVQTALFDATNFKEHEFSVNSAFSELTQVDALYIAYGSLPDQKGCQLDPVKVIDELQVNAVSVVSILTLVANKLEQQGFGSIAVITSVAGDRGRESNYVYGAAKGMVSIFLQGLSQRLSKCGVHVLDVKPGFVDTPMTRDFKKGILWSKPEKIAIVIKRRVEKRSYFSYVPSFWAGIMLVIKLLPRAIYNKVSL